MFLFQLGEYLSQKDGFNLYIETWCIMLMKLLSACFYEKASFPT